jgi:hypothetical protein
MPTEPRPVSLFEVVKRAVDVCDPDESDANLGDLLAEFEDADEPISAIEPQDLDERIALAVERVDPDPEGDDAGVAVAAAVIRYLAYRRDEVGGEPHAIMRLAARSEWDGDPPDHVAIWLVNRGVDL